MTSCSTFALTNGKSHAAIMYERRLNERDNKRAFHSTKWGNWLSCRVPLAQENMAPDIQQNRASPMLTQPTSNIRQGRHKSKRGTRQGMEGHKSHHSDQQRTHLVSSPQNSAQPEGDYAVTRQCMAALQKSFPSGNASSKIVHFSSHSCTETALSLSHRGGSRRQNL